MMSDPMDAGSIQADYINLDVNGAEDGLNLDLLMAQLFSGDDLPPPPQQLQQQPPAVHHQQPQLVPAPPSSDTPDPVSGLALPQPHQQHPQHEVQHPHYQVQQPNLLSPRQQQETEQPRIQLQQQFPPPQYQQKNLQQPLQQQQQQQFQHPQGHQQFSLQYHYEQSPQSQQQQRQQQLQPQYQQQLQLQPQQQPLQQHQQQLQPHPQQQPQQQHQQQLQPQIQQQSHMQHQSGKHQQQFKLQHQQQLQPQQQQQLQRQPQQQHQQQSQQQLQSQHQHQPHQQMQQQLQRLPQQQHQHQLQQPQQQSQQQATRLPDCPEALLTTVQRNASLVELPVETMNAWNAEQKLRWLKMMLVRHISDQQRLPNPQHWQALQSQAASVGLETLVADAGQLCDTATARRLRAELCAWRRVYEYHAARIKPEPKEQQSYGRGGTGDKLWEHVLRLLMEKSPTVKWLKKGEGLFCFVDSSEAARSWGHTKDNANMSFEKMSRSIRQYYKEDGLGIIQKAVEWPKLHYRFNMAHPDVVEFMDRNWPNQLA